MEDKLLKLKQRLMEIDDLNRANYVLQWDQATYLPAGGAVARGRQIATIGRLAQEKATSDEMGALIEALLPYADQLDDGSDDGRLIRLCKRNYDRGVKVPPALVGQLLQQAAASYAAWAVARPNNDFAAVLPHMERTLDLSRQVANCFEYEHIIDPFIAQYDYGMTAETVSSLFSELRGKLVPLVEAVTACEAADSSVLQKRFPIDQQQAFGESIIRQYGYDFNRGRQDLTLHPFMITFSLGDVRITTRFDENDFGDGLFSTLHEAGHAMYEQGINLAYDGTPFASGTSSGVHESQSRLWENIVGRSRAFWEHYYPQAQATFPEQLGNVSVEAFYRAINKVSRSLIRVDADELTYNLHVMIRYDLEMQLMDGRLALKDLPEAWHARYESDLGVRAASDSDGVLQDVHWFSGPIGGAFQGYTLGNVMSAAFYDRALVAHPGISADIGRGDFSTLHGWLSDNIYQHGSKYTAPELVERITDGPLSIDPYVNYLTTKFSDLYAL